MNKLKQNQKGFTLIELLVVIAIIGLLASVVLLALGSARSKSRDAKRVADARQISSAMELFFNDNNSYPQTASGFSSLTPSYIGAVPTYPTPAEGGCSMTTFTGYAGTSTSYSFQFCLGQTTGGLAPGTHTVSQAGIQ